MFDVGEVAHLVCLGRMHRGGTASLIYVWRRVRFSLCLRCYNDMAVYKKIKLKGFRMKDVKGTGQALWEQIAYAEELAALWLQR